MSRTLITATVDFETFKIEGREHPAPIPVGVAIYAPLEDPVYYSWGHPYGNNSTKEEAYEALKAVYDRWPILCHNTKFDFDVANAHMGMPLLPKHGYHETMFLAFANNPHELTYSLKPLADRYLDMPPEEQAAVYEYINNHVFTSEPKGEGEVQVCQMGKPEGWHHIPPSMNGAFIAYAPGDLVGQYAVGDVVRTSDLFDLWWPEIIAKGMGAWYQMELDLMPILLENEREGVRVDASGLRDEVVRLETDLEIVNKWLLNRLGDINLDSGNQVADAMEKLGVVSEWKRTPKGKRSTKKDDLVECCSDIDLVNVFRHRNILIYNLRTFCRPWLAQLETTGDRIHTSWNQIRGEGGGARTGRLSGNPNFLNVPNPAKAPTLPEDLKSQGVAHLPFLRNQIIPDDSDSVLLGVDFSAQEIRILAHFEKGSLLDGYLANPGLDVYQDSADQLKAKDGVVVSRKEMKVIFLAVLYGMGLASLAKALGTTKDIAKGFMDAFLSSRPDVAALKKRTSRGREIITMGGRIHPVEKPKMIDGKMRTFEYKLLNALIQGSAAVMTKWAMIQYCRNKQHGRLVLSIHDELMISVPKSNWESELVILKDAMEDMSAFEFSVPVTTDAAMSDKSWGEMVEL